MHTSSLMSTVMALVIAAPAAGQLSGPATVVDGDTLTISGQQVRLHGIDAPEYKQTCSRDGAPWACGEEAARQLNSLVAGASVTCAEQGSDTYGRLLAVCAANGIELNRAMVAHGWATAYREYSPAYVADELRAKSARRGIWRATFQLPQDYRRAREPVFTNSVRGSAGETPQRLARSRGVSGPIGRCAIKGNQNRKGQWIYHLPGMPFYDVTRAEQFFCTEGEARAAGYRRAMVR